MLTDYHNGEEKEVYFYHSDHLGSASWITDSAGIAVQHLQYLPYGEPYVDQRTSGYRERFRFTGKEKDEETGYGYFGARYMDHELITMWLSVDPMMDKYPSISPYAYCAWNPVKLVDPDGREAIDEDDWYKNKETGAAFWREGHAKQIQLGGDTYDNIGESFSALNIDGTYSNYYQNYLITIGEERDASKLAYRDKGLRTFLISNRSKLPICHKQDLFNSHVACRGVSPDMIGLHLGGNIIIGGGYTFDIAIGFVKNDGFFISFSPGAGSGFDMSLEAGFCIGFCSGTPTIDGLRGMNYISSVGYGSFFYQHSLSEQTKTRWSISTFGYSKGGKVPSTGSVGVSYSF